MSSAAHAPEQDVGGGDGLPTYENLAQAHGPNSRFGRWRSWVEKRAAERYADITPEERERRKQRGWGDGIADDVRTARLASCHVVSRHLSTRLPQAVPGDGSSTPRPSTSIPTLRLNTDFDVLPTPPIRSDELLEYDPTQPILGESLQPAHLGLHHLGSRFLPHSTFQIRALLPLLGDRLLLIGHDDGLSVLNMFPQEWTDAGLQTRGPGEAHAHPIWTGEGVFQMSLLEVEEVGESTPQGVALLLVGSDPENGKEQECTRTLRMYNLASLISLAKWAISPKGVKPLDLHRPPNWHPHRSTTKKHKPSGSLAKSLRSLMTDSSQDLEPPSSYQAMLQGSPGSSSRTAELRPRLQERSSTIDSGWDVVDDLPLRWATDYVPLAAPGSRLMNSPVSTYALWRNDDQARGSALLAVAVKSAILLYESPKGERAFRFVKEFYTPLLPRSIAFVYQSIQDNLSRSTSEASGFVRPASQHLRASRGSMRQRPTSLLSTVLNPQLSLFIVFEKKVGLIRIINSAVGEVTLFEDANAHSSRDSLSPSQSGLSARRSRTSLDGFGLAKDHRGSWTLPAKLDLPAGGSTNTTPDMVDPWDAPSAAALEDAPPQSVYLLTRGKQTFVLPCPLPANLQVTAPLLTFSWRSHPTFVAPRVIEVEYGGDGGGPSPWAATVVPVVPRRMLQLTAFGEDGLEVQETPLSFSVKEKARLEDPVVSEVVIGETGFLCGGGHWHRPYDSPLGRSDSVRSGVSFDSIATEEVISRLESDKGIYGWQRRGLEDWRIFWIGGMGEEQRTDDDD
ncbi:hypothetical protein BJY52DRAFT_56697 [Lactarius psammicola]|nr:hypothetical protein BJY52DRAFT_56697 [Lactarius psammicola]